MPGHVRARGKRADGTTIWQARWRHPVELAHRRESNHKTKRAALDWINEQEADAKRGSYTDPRRGDARFTAVADEWRETWADLAPKTRVGYESILRCHVLPEFGDKRVAGITSKDVQEFVNGLAASENQRGRRTSPNTVRRIMDVLRNVLRVAVERRYIAVSPADAVKLPKKGSGRNIDITPLTHGEVRALVDALPEEWRLPVLLDVYTGLRAGELWALRRRDVDLLRGELVVEHAIKEVTSDQTGDLPAGERLTPSLIIGATKTYARRRISLPDFIRAELAAHLGRSLPGGDGPGAFIFTTPERTTVHAGKHGRPVGARYGGGEPVRHNLFYKRTFAPAVAAAFPGRTLRFHDLRHTCAAWLIAAGAHPLQIKLRLGHEDIKTTMNTYGHLFPSAEPELAGLLDAGYRGAEDPPAAVALP